MDEFSWFVGLYEGEGTITAASKPGRREGRENRYWNLCMVVKMTDEDTIQRAARFLNVSYKEVKKDKPHCKRIYRVRKQGGLNGELYDLLMRMKPHLCKRRQEQIDSAITTVKGYAKV